MKKTNLFKSIAATLGATFILAIVATSVSADYGNYKNQERTPRLTQEERQEKMEERRAERETHRTEMDVIMEAGDYNAWVTAITERHPDAEILTIITADNFSRLIEIHQLRKEGYEKMQEAKVIADELGIPDHNGKRALKKGMRRGMGNR